MFEEVYRYQSKVQMGRHTKKAIGQTKRSSPCVALVYQIPCKDCSQTYIDQSHHNMMTARIKEHQWAVNMST